jgi:hypothetical protein
MLRAVCDSGFAGSESKQPRSDANRAKIDNRGIRVLTDAEALPADEQEMLERLLRQRRIETWRQETAAEARNAIKAFRSGKLKSQSAKSLIANLRESK